MTQVSYTDEQLAAGRRRLKEMLERCKAEFSDDDGNRFQNAEMSPLAGSVFSRVKESNLSAVVVYEGKKGDFYADVIFKDMPAGVPNSMGTPISLPLKSRQEAEQSGYHTLCMIMSLIKSREEEPEAGKDDVCWFELYDMHASFPIEAVETIRAVMGSLDWENMTPQMRHDFDTSVPVAASRLRENLASIMGEPDVFDLDTWMKAVENQHEGVGKVNANMLALLMNGVFRYPLREVESRTLN